MSDRPPLAEQKDLLEKSISGLRRQGFAHEMKVISAKAQTPHGPQDVLDREELIKDNTGAAENCYAGAAALTAALQKIEAEITASAPPTPPTEG